MVHNERHTSLSSSMLMRCHRSLLCGETVTCMTMNFERREHAHNPALFFSLISSTSDESWSYNSTVRMTRRFDLFEKILAFTDLVYQKIGTHRRSLDLMLRKMNSILLSSRQFLQFVSLSSLNRRSSSHVCLECLKNIRLGYERASVDSAGWLVSTMRVNT